MITVWPPEDSPSVHLYHTYLAEKVHLVRLSLVYLFYRKI